MNIALICTEKLPVPSIAGGAVQIYIDGILPYLSKHHNITVFSIAYPGLKQEEVNDGVRYIRVPANNVTEYVNAVKSRLTGDFDLVHIFNRPASVVELSRGLPGVRFSLSLHNEMFAAEKLPAPKAAECISKVEFINTVSRFIANGVERLYPEASGKLNVVYSGADADKYKPNWTNEGIASKNRLKEKYKLQNRKVVLFVGRLSEKKGVHILLKAMNKIMSTRRDVALVIVGSKWFGANKTDDYTALLQKLSKSLSGPVVLTGFLPPSEVIEHYNLGDIFVCPSQWNEPLARVHYEAMAAGLPIITTNRGGNAEVVSGKGNGVVIEDYSNPDVLAENISYFLNTPSKISEMGKEGRRLVETVYNWERVAADILKKFADVEAKKGLSVPKNEAVPKQKPENAPVTKVNPENTPVTNTKPESAPVTKVKPESAPVTKEKPKTETGSKINVQPSDYSSFLNVSETYKNYLNKLEKWRNSGN